jgi:hypothetical protein
VRNRSGGDTRTGQHRGELTGLLPGEHDGLHPNTMTSIAA